MRLKEAQLLGILAIIAILIIVLCMWGSGPNLEGVARVEVGETPESANLGARDIVEGMRGVHNVAPEEAETSDDDVVRVDITGSGLPPVDESRGLGAEELVGSESVSGFFDDEETRSERLREELVEWPEPTEPPIRPRPASRVHVVLKGDTLWEISAQYYGTASLEKCKTIVRANRPLIQDVNSTLQPGMRLVIPGLDEAPARTVASQGEQPPLLSGTTGSSAAGSGGRHYVVKKGDKLWNIAQELYDDPQQWKKILAANSDLIKKPEDLRPDMSLSIP